MSTSSPLYPPLSNTSTPSVSGRIFVITGGTQGLGLAIAQQLQAWGAAGLVLVSRSAEKGKSVAKELQELDKTSSCRVVHIAADLSDAAAVQDILPSAVRTLAGDGEEDSVVISGLVNAAATTTRGNLFTTTAQDFDYQFALNTRAPFLLTQAVAQHVLDRCQKAKKNGTTIPSASIVNITSVAAHGGAPFIMAYSASKAALVNLTKTQAAQLAPHGIRINAVNMGWTFTDAENTLQTAQRDAHWISRADASAPLGRILRPVDVAVTVCFLLSDASAMTTGTIMDLHPEFAHGLISLQATDER